MKYLSKPAALVAQTLSEHGCLEDDTGGWPEKTRLNHWELGVVILLKGIVVDGEPAVKNIDDDLFSHDFLFAVVALGLIDVSGLDGVIEIINRERLDRVIEDLLERRESDGN